MEKWYVVCEDSKRLEEMLSMVQGLCTEHGIIAINQLPSVHAFIIPYDGSKPEFEEALRSLSGVRDIYRASEAKIPERGSKGL